MHWATPTFIIWAIELAGFITMVWSVTLLASAIKRMEGSLRKPLLYILGSSLTYLVLGVYVTIAVTKQFDFESYLWIITFGLGLLVAMFLVIGAKKLLNEIENS